MSTRARTLLAWTVVLLTVIAVWKFVEYRTQPPAVKAVISDQRGISPTGH
jgi:hypothetical protein